MKIVIKQSDIKTFNPMKESLRTPLYRKRVEQNKKVYNRKKVKIDV